MIKHMVENVPIEDINNCIKDYEDKGWEFVPPVVLGTSRICPWVLLTFKKEE